MANPFGFGSDWLEELRKRFLKPRETPVTRTPSRKFTASRALDVAKKVGFVGPKERGPEMQMRPSRLGGPGGVPVEKPTVLPSFQPELEDITDINIFNRRVKTAFDSFMEMYGVKPPVALIDAVTFDNKVPTEGISSMWPKKDISRAMPTPEAQIEQEEKLAIRGIDTIIPRPISTQDRIRSAVGKPEKWEPENIYMQFILSEAATGKAERAIRDAFMNYMPLASIVAGDVKERLTPDVMPAATMTAHRTLMNTIPEYKASVELVNQSLTQIKGAALYPLMATMEQALKGIELLDETKIATWLAYKSGDREKWEDPIKDTIEYPRIWKECFKKAKGKTLGQEVAGLNPETHPMMHFFADLGCHLATDYVLFKGLGAGKDLAKVPLSRVAKNLPWIDDASRIISKSKSPSTIKETFGLPGGEGLDFAVKLADEANTPEQAMKLLLGKEGMAVHGGRIRPGDTYIWKRLKSLVAHNPKVQERIPFELRSLFQFNPPFHVNVNSSDRGTQIHQMLRIMGTNDKTALKYSDDVIRAKTEMERMAVFQSAYKTGKEAFDLERGAGAFDKMTNLWRNNISRLSSEQQRGYLYVPVEGVEKPVEKSIVKWGERVTGLKTEIKSLKKQGKLTPDVNKSLQGQLKEAMAHGADETVAVPAFYWQRGAWFSPEVPFEFIGKSRLGKTVQTLDFLETRLGLDFGTRLWKDLVLGSPISAVTGGKVPIPSGTQLRILSDEPTRMLSQGLNPTRVFQHFIPGGKRARRKILSNFGLNPEMVGEGGATAIFKVGAKERVSFVDHLAYVPGKNYSDDMAAHWMNNVARDPVFVSYRDKKAGAKGILNWLKGTDEGKHFAAITGRVTKTEQISYAKMMTDFFDDIAKKYPEVNELLKRTSLRKGTITKKDIKRIPHDVNHLPVITGRAPLTTGPTSALEAAEEYLFKPLSMGMQAIREEMAIQFGGKEKVRLLALRKLGKVNVSDEKIAKLSANYAMDMLEKSTYTSARTVFESAARNITPFLPAYREFYRFWAREVARRPSRLITYSRFQKMPEEVEVPVTEPFFKMIGMEGWTQKLYPKTWLFITGGSGPQGQNWLAQNWPGYGPLITIPVQAARAHFPEAFGKEWEEKPPMGFEFTRPGMPISTKHERALWFLSGLAKGLISDDFRGIDLGYPFGRDADTRRRITNTLAKVQAAREGEIDLKEAIKQVWKGEGLKALWGFISPMSGTTYEKDVNDVLSSSAKARDIKEKLVKAEGKEKTKLNKELKALRDDPRTPQIEIDGKLRPLFDVVEEYHTKLTSGQKGHLLRKNPQLIPFIVGYTERKREVQRAETREEYSLQMALGQAEVMEPENFVWKMWKRFRKYTPFEILSQTQLGEIAKKLNINLESKEFNLEQLQTDYQRERNQIIDAFVEGDAIKGGELLEKFEAVWGKEVDHRDIQQSYEDRLLDEWDRDIRSAGKAVANKLKEKYGITQRPENEEKAKSELLAMTSALHSYIDGILEARGKERLKPKEYPPLRAQYREYLLGVLDEFIIAGRKGKAVEGWEEFRKIYVNKNKALEKLGKSPSSDPGKEVIRQYYIYLFELERDNPAFTHEFIFFPKSAWTYEWSYVKE